MTVSLADLAHSHAQVRHQAMAELIEVGQIAPLLAGLNEAHMEVIWRSAAILGWLGKAEAIPALVARAQGAEYEIKYNCIWALGQINDRAAIPALLAIVEADETESPDVRYNAALALIRLGEMAYLKQAVDSDHEATYRVAHAALATARVLAGLNGSPA